MRRAIPILATAALLTGLYFEARTHPTPTDAYPFHARVKEMVQAIPSTFGPWVGTDVEIPTPAQALLRPNAVLCRKYVDVDGRRQASVTLIQCADSRDMSGHYPPNCYPSQGWTQDRAEPRDILIGTRAITMVRYVMSRPPAVSIAIYNFFELPRRGSATDLAAVRGAAEDYRTRHLGAAQVQVVLVDPSLTQAEEESIVRELLAPMADVLARLGDGPEEINP